MKIIKSDWHHRIVYNLLKPASLFARTCWCLVRKFSPAKRTMTNFNLLTSFQTFYLSSFNVLNVESVNILLITCPQRKKSLVFRDFSKKLGVIFHVISSNLPELALYCLAFWVYACLIWMLLIKILSSFLKIVHT